MTVLAAGSLPGVPHRSITGLWSTWPIVTLRPDVKTWTTDGIFTDLNYNLN